MGCCGNKRAAAAASSKQPKRPQPQPARQVEKPEVYFKYTGETALRVHGIFSRRLYYFKQPGAVLAVSGSDAPGMKAVPMLKPVSMD